MCMCVSDSPAQVLTSESLKLDTSSLVQLVEIFIEAGQNAVCLCVCVCLDVNQG